MVLSFVYVVLASLMALFVLNFLPALNIFKQEIPLFSLSLIELAASFLIVAIAFPKTSIRQIFFLTAKYLFFIALAFAILIFSPFETKVPFFSLNIQEGMPFIVAINVAALVLINFLVFIVLIYADKMSGKFTAKTNEDQAIEQFEKKFNPAASSEDEVFPSEQELLEHKAQYDIENPDEEVKKPALKAVPDLEHTVPVTEPPASAQTKILSEILGVSQQELENQNDQNYENLEASYHSTHFDEQASMESLGVSQTENPGGIFSSISAVSSDKAAPPQSLAGERAQAEQDNYNIIENETTASVTGMPTPEWLQPAETETDINHDEELRQATEDQAQEQAAAEAEARARAARALKRAEQEQAAEKAAEKLALEQAQALEAQKELEQQALAEEQAAANLAQGIPLIEPEQTSVIENIDGSTAEELSSLNNSENNLVAEPPVIAENNEEQQNLANIDENAQQDADTLFNLQPSEQDQQIQALEALLINDNEKSEETKNTLDHDQANTTSSSAASSATTDEAKPSSSKASKLEKLNQLSGDESGVSISGKLSKNEIREKLEELEELVHKTIDEQITGVLCLNNKFKTLKDTIFVWNGIPKDKLKDVFNLNQELSDALTGGTVQHNLIYNQGEWYFIATLDERILVLKAKEMVSTLENGFNVLGAAAN
jgi:hypothetical protein